MQNTYRSILIVEDDSDIRDALQDILTLEGFHAESVTNGKEALEYLQTKSPALIFLDLMMPVMDGKMFLKEFSKSFPESNIPVILLSAALNTQVDYPIVGFLKKPLDLDSLLNQARKLTGSGRPSLESHVS